MLGIAAVSVHKATEMLRRLLADYFLRCRSKQPLCCMWPSRSTHPLLSCLLTAVC